MAEHQVLVWDMDVCVCARHMWLFTLDPLENAATVSETCGPADKVKGFRVPHNFPLSVEQGEWILRTAQWLVQGEVL